MPNAIEARLSTPVNFDHPPVVETALAVAFAPIAGWNILHFGQLWDVFRKKYARAEIKPPLGNAPEIIGSWTSQITAIQDQILGQIPLRYWFINQGDTELVQVQSNRFIRNWRKRPESPEYVRYENVRPRFVEDWHQYLRFLNDQRLPEPAVLNCEVSYFNHIERGQGWDSYEDLPRLFPFLGKMQPGELLNTPQAVGFSVTYSLLHADGRLQINGAPGLRGADGKEIYQLTLMATVKSKFDEILRAMDAAHAAVIHGFCDFTTDAAQRIWGKK